MKRLITLIALAILLSPLAVVHAQAATAVCDDAKTTSAYSVLVLRKAALEAELEELLREYDENWPATKRKQFEYDTLVREMKRVSEMPESSISRLTSAYGTLVLREVSLESKLQSLLLENTEEWPEVKRIKVELAALRREINDIMR